MEEFGDSEIAGAAAHLQLWILRHKHLVRLITLEELRYEKVIRVEPVRLEACPISLRTSLDGYDFDLSAGECFELRDIRYESEKFEQLLELLRTSRIIETRWIASHGKVCRRSAKFEESESFQNDQMFLIMYMAHKFFGNLEKVTSICESWEG